MAQPWQFLGYQKLASDTASVYFTNWFPAGTNASSYWDFDYKLVMETVVNDPWVNGNEAGPYYRLQMNSVTGNDICAWSAQSNNTTSGSIYSWGASPTALTNSRDYMFDEPYNGWIMAQGRNTDPTDGMRRYASGEDDTQWGTYEVGYTKQHNAGHNMRMKGFNVQSRQDGAAQGYNSYMASAGSTSSVGTPPNSLLINAANYTFLAGSKFWLWACRTTNDY